VPSNDYFLNLYNYKKIYKPLDGFHVEFNRVSGKQFLAISGQSVWQECSMRIFHIAGGSDLECSDIRIEVLPSEECTRSFQIQLTPVEYHNDVSNEIRSEQGAVGTLGNTVNGSETTNLGGDLYIRCKMQDAAEAFPCDDRIVTVPAPSGKAMVGFLPN
jgi:hypothetical protein